MKYEINWKRIGWIGMFFWCWWTAAFAQTCADAPNHPACTLERWRPSYPTPMTSAQLGELLNRAAYEHRLAGYGLLRKDAGRLCIAPAGWAIACDILTQRLSSGFVTHFDALIDAEGAAAPAWQERGLVDSARFLPPTDPANTPPTTPPAPPPPPTPPAPDLTPVLEAIATLRTQLDMVIHMVSDLATLPDQIGVVQSQLQVLMAREHPALRGRVLGWPVTLRPQP